MQDGKHKLKPDSSLPFGFALTMTMTGFERFVTTTTGLMDAQTGQNVRSRSEEDEQEFNF